MKDDKSFTSGINNVVMGGNMRGKAYRRSMQEKKDMVDARVIVLKQ